MAVTSRWPSSSARSPKRGGCASAVSLVAAAREQSGLRMRRRTVLVGGVAGAVGAGAVPCRSPCARDVDAAGGIDVERNLAAVELVEDGMAVVAEGAIDLPVS